MDFKEERMEGCYLDSSDSNLGPGTGYAENSRESDQLKYLEVGKRIILKWISKRIGWKDVSWIHLTLDMG
jgi:hypothetical protein